MIGIVEQADATPSQQAIREVNAGVYAFDVAALRSALSRLRSDNAQQELYLTDVISIVRQDGHVVRASHVDDSALVAGRQRPGAAGRARRRAQPPHRGRPSTRGRDDRRPRHHLDRRRRDHRPRHRRSIRARSCSARRASAGSCQIGPDTTLTDVTVGDDGLGGPHPRQLVADRRRRRRRPVHLPAARHRAGRRRQARRVRRNQERDDRRPAPRCRT